MFIKKIKKQLIISIIIISILIINLFPKSISIFYSAQANYCLKSSNYECALRFAKNSIFWNKNNSDAYHILGNTFVAINNIDEAILNLEKADRLRPKDLLLLKDLAIAYEKGSYEDYAVSTWMRAGINSKIAENIGDNYLNKGQYQDAFEWLTRAKLTQDISLLSPSQIFKLALASILSNQINSDFLFKEAQLKNSNIIINNIDNNSLIPGHELIWLTNTNSNPELFGENLLYNNPNNIGTMWWDGQAITFINIPSDGNYLISYKLKNSQPAPIQIAVDINGIQVKNLSLDKGDNSWEEVNISINLNKGTYILGIWFLNNAIINNIDRNLEIDSINIIPLNNEH